MLLNNAYVYRDERTRLYYLISQISEARINKVLLYSIPTEAAAFSNLLFCSNAKFCTEHITIIKM